MTELRPTTELLGYRELYQLWERQQWATQDIDFSRDREDWHARFSEQERRVRMYGLSSFLHGEQRVTVELGPILRAVPDEDMRIFLSTQIADEARHVAFFDRFYEEVGILEAGGLSERLSETAPHLTEGFSILFDELLGSRVRRLEAEPEDAEALVESVALYHMIVEGMLALTGQTYMIGYNEARGTLPGLVEGFKNVSRDEHRHVAFGARFLRDVTKSDERLRSAAMRMIEQAKPYAESLLVAPWDYEEEIGLFGMSQWDFAEQALWRRLRAIGLAG